MSSITIQSALISVYHKDGLAPIVKQLNDLGVTIYSTGGTQQFINDLGIPVIPVEEVTTYPSILGGRVKTLHPKIFGGILNRRNDDHDQSQLSQYSIPQLDLVIVDLYPFEQTVSDGASEQEIIEKIDIGGISLIRAAAKNYTDTLCVSTRSQYSQLLAVINQNNGATTIGQRKQFAAAAFDISSHYDSAIYNYFTVNNPDKSLKISQPHVMPLRYGENPHQQGWFYGDFDQMFNKLHGKELSYNNLLDVDAAINLMSEFLNESPTFAIFKHNNACGVAQRDTVLQAYTDALAGDPISAFGGILITNQTIDTTTAQQINQLFCEVIIAPDYEPQALEVLQSKKNRIILELVGDSLSRKRTQNKLEIRTNLNGYLVQEANHKTDSLSDLTTATNIAPTDSQLTDLLFASKISKHTKSNTIVLVKDKQLCASGTGQTSRVDALNQAVHKAQSFKFNLSGAVMASDAFFPFPDCVEIAHQAGITAVIQPGGSIKDQLSIDYCNKNDLSMVFTGTRHFKH